MGFGLMFVGYLIMSLGAFTPLSTFTWVIGSAILLYSLKELVFQNKAFIVSMALVAMTLLSSTVYMFVYVLGGSNVVLDICLTIQKLLSLLFNIVLLWAIYIIAKEVELNQIRVKVIITYIPILIYVVFIVLANAISFDSDTFSRVFFVVTACQIIYIVMSLVTILNSYMRICYEDDIDMNKKSSNGVMRFLNDQLNRVMTPKEKRNLEFKNKDKKDDNK